MDSRNPYFERQNLELFSEERLMGHMKLQKWNDEAKANTVTPMWDVSDSPRVPAHSCPYPVPFKFNPERSGEWFL